jgi:transcriptional regulator with XRE-family HTH domain
VQIAFGQRVRRLREAKGWTQEELAEKADIHRTYLGGIERGLRNVALRNIAKIAQAFDLSLSEFFQY